MTIEIPAHVAEIIDRLEAAGHSAYAVGGSLRDAILGIPPHDWDITTSSLPEETASLFPDKHVIPTGIKHGTVTVVNNGDPIEVTTYRVDGEYTDSRRPDSVSFTTSIEDDLSRRDFTVNAMAYSEKRGLVDLFGGREDLRRGIIRAVGDPEKRFTEDALRIMRAFRFSAQLDFEIEENTLRAALKLGGRLKNIAAERISSELLRLLGSVAAGRALASMGTILREILPVSLPTDRLCLVDSLKRDGIARLALLLHGRTAEEISSVASSLKLSGEQKKRLSLLALAEPPEDSSGPSLRRFLRALGDDAPKAAAMLALLGSAPHSLEADLLTEAALSPCVSVGGLAVGGRDLIAEGIASGPSVGHILSLLLEAVIDDPSLNEKQLLIDAARELVDHHE